MTRTLTVALIAAAVSVTVSLLVIAVLVAHPAGCRGRDACRLDRRTRCEHVAARNAAYTHLPTDPAALAACVAGTP